MTSEASIDPLDAAAQHAELRVPVSRAALPKRVVERVILFLVAPQRAYNRGVIDAIRMLRADAEQFAHRVALLEQRLSADEEIARVAADVRAEMRELHAQVSEGLTDEALTRAQVVDIAQAVQRMEQRVAHLDATLARDPARD
jgi:uncharacterized protein (DUF2164 family)